MTYHQWQVVVAKLEPVNGSDQVGPRNVLVISNDAYNENLPYLTVIPISTTPRSPAPSEVILEPGFIQGATQVTAMAHHLRTISKDSVLGVVTEIRDVTTQKVIVEAVLSHLGFDVPTVSNSRAGGPNQFKIGGE